MKVPEPKFIGVDIKGHNAIVVNPNTGEFVLKLDQDIIQHKHARYESFKMTRSIADRNTNLLRDQNRITSKKILEAAVNAKAGIRMKQLQDNQLQDMIEQKANLQGVSIEYIDSFMSTKTCHQCGSIGTITKTSTDESKQFTCPNNTKHTFDAATNSTIDLLVRIIILKFTSPETISVQDAIGFKILSTVFTSASAAYSDM
jgi:transposase